MRWRNAQRAHWPFPGGGTYQPSGQTGEASGQPHVGWGVGDSRPGARTLPLYLFIGGLRVPRSRLALRRRPPTADRHVLIIDTRSRFYPEVFSTLWFFSPGLSRVSRRCDAPAAVNRRVGSPPKWHACLVSPCLLLSGRVLPRRYRMFVCLYVCLPACLTVCLYSRGHGGHPNTPGAQPQPQRSPPTYQHTQRPLLKSGAQGLAPLIHCRSQCCARF